MKRLLDLFCGRGGWSRPFLARGWECVGVDLTNHGYPGELRQHDARELSTAELDSFNLIVASPPCEEFARACLPWLRGDQTPDPAAIELLEWSVQLGKRTRAPVVVECSKFAARFVPGSRLIGSWAFWGDVPLIMPHISGGKEKMSGRDPAARAMVPPEFGHWLATVFGCAMLMLTGCATVRDDHVDVKTRALIRERIAAIMDLIGEGKAR